ncbi:putative RecA/RadA family phage recombinase [Gemmobacter caeni]|uniref:Putative RecA/RadA family phage recombinase n=1 Tax=Gemmobacter caeni TaxID=589035 RepID=A0A2T6A4J7_9RHOB|nr:DUF2190 family protein [Gemmobacter caeni]PTX38716.1 putative RecA/RadA family phage recombinase [Gemmobacter caeni]TWJ05762.1 putative RecA/RadA family phage recombinase [Gemmobacter caeni]
MQNYIQPGQHLTIAAAAAILSGELIFSGAICGVAQGSAEIGDPVVLVRTGVFELPKLGAQAWTVGAKIYWDATNKQCTTVASGNTLIGAAAEAAANPSATGMVLLDGVIR